MTWRTRDAVLVQLGLALVGVLLFFQPLVLGETWFQRDALGMHQTYRSHVFSAIAAGRLPEWWDAIGLGVPVAGNPLFGVTYPVTWLLAPLPAAYAVDLLFALHVLLGGAGVARLARRFGAAPLGAFVGGACFMASGFVMSMIVMGIPLLTLAWTLHVLATADDVARAPDRRTRVRALLALAALEAMQLMSGDPAGVITSGLLMLIVVAARAPRPAAALAHVAGGVLAALPLAALLVLPALGFLADSPRQGGMGAEGASVWSMHPWRFLEMIWPHAFGETTDQRYHLGKLLADSGHRGNLQASFAPVIYVGLPVFVLAGWAISAGTRESRRLAWIAGGATILFTLLALGWYTPFYAFFRLVFVPERIVRYPERHIAGALVVWCTLAGVGFTRALALAAPRRVLVSFAAATAGLAALVGAAALARAPLVAWLADLPSKRPPPVNVPHAVDLAITTGWSGVAVLAVTSAALALRAVPRLERVARLAPGIVALALVGHLVGENTSAAPTLARADVLALPEWMAGPLAADRAAHRAGAPLARVFRDGGVARVTYAASPAVMALIAHDSVADHTMTLWDLADVPGYDTTSPERNKRIWWRTVGPAFERVLDLFAVKWALLPFDDARGQTLPVRATTVRQYALHENESRRPRAFVAPRWVWVDGVDAAQAALFAPELDFAAVRLEGTGAAPPAEAADAPLVPCEVTTPRPERVTLRCASERGGWAVILDAWSPGWSARVDGRPAPIVRADSLARAVQVGPGAHTLDFVYRAPGLRAGAAISGLAWLLLAAAWLWQRRLPRQQSGEAVVAERAPGA